MLVNPPASASAGLFSLPIPFFLNLTFLLLEVHCALLLLRTPDTTRKGLGEERIMEERIVMREDEGTGEGSGAVG